MIYEIWMEGYCCTGQSSTAFLVAKIEADSFQEACDMYFKGDFYYDPKTLMYWGCRLFDNEVDARKSFG